MKHSMHRENSDLVLLKLFINGYAIYHITDAHMSEALFSNVNNMYTIYHPRGLEQYNYKPKLLAQNHS